MVHSSGQGYFKTPFSDMQLVKIFGREAQTSRGDRVKVVEESKTDLGGESD